MKKFLLILCALVCGTFAFAQNGYYTDWMHVVVNDNDDGVVKSTVSVKYNSADNTAIDFTLHDFTVDIYMSGWISLPLGDVTVNGIQLGETVDGVATFSCTDNHDVEYPDADQSYASWITDVTVNMTGDLSETKLRANMEITVHVKMLGLIDMGDYPITAAFGYEYGEYLIVNTETGNYLGGGLDWGTHATEIGKPQFFSCIEQTDGTYTLNGHQGSSTSIGWDEAGSDLYIDGAQPLTWELVEADGGYYIATEKGYLTGNGFQTAVTLKSTAGSTALWKLVTMDDVVATMDDATADNPVDVTPLIPAPEPKNANWGDSWTATGYGVSADPGNFSFGSGWNTASCAESYHSANGFDAHQTFSLPKAGFYTLTAQAFYRSDGSSTVLPSIYVTTGTSATDASGTLTSLPLPVLTTSAASMEAAYQEFLKEQHPVSITFMVDEGEEGSDITVGFDGNVAEDNEMWTIFGELGLTYSGVYYPELTAVTGMMNIDVEAAQTAALSAYASSPSAATYSAALNAIQAATESIAHYAEITDALDSGKYDSVLASFDDAGQAAFEDDFMAAYNARTLTDETIEEGLAAACKLQVTEGADMSFALKNSGTWVNAIIELSSNSGASFQLCPQLPTAHEVWSASAWNLGRDVLERKAIYKQIEDLPAGTYTLSFYAYGSEAATAATRPLAYANDADEQEVAYLADLGNAWTDASIYTFVCEVGDDGILEFGMKTQGDGNWYVMEEYSLTLDGMPKAVVHEEEAEFDDWSIAPTGGGTFQYNTWSTEADPSGMKTPFIEYWVGSGNRLGDATISHQTLSDLTPGFYVVSLDMRAFNENSLNKIEPGIVLSANGTSVDVSLGTHDVFNKVSAEAYGTYEVPCMVGADGTLDIAITLTDCNCDWLAFKNLKVTYMGTEYDLPAVAEVKAVEGDMSTAKSEAQQAAIEAYTASQTPATAIDLYLALTDAQLSANFYAEIAATLEELDLDEAGQAVWAASENGAAYEAKTLEYCDMTDTYLAAAKAQTTEGKDITLVIEDSEWIGHTGTYQTGWEIYNGSGLGEGKILYQHIDGLVAGGTYEVSFYAAANVARDLDTSVWAGDGIAQVFANDETEDITVGTLDALDDIAAEEYKHTLTAQADEDGVLEFGMQNVKAGGQWYVAQAISLTIVSVPETTDGNDNDYEVGDEVDVDGVAYTVVGENMFVNGGFGNGMNGWTAGGYTTAADPDNFDVETEGGYNGGAYLVASSAGATNAKTPSQAIAVEVGKTYMLVAYTSGKTPDSNNLRYSALFEMEDATTEASHTEGTTSYSNDIITLLWGADAGATTDEWTQTIGVFEATTEYVGMRMGWSGGSYDGFQLYEVEAAEVEPEPESSAYVFVCTDWGSIDLGRVTDDNVTYDETNNTITVVASGTNNVALSNGREAPFTTANMTVTNKQCWYTVVGTNISTADGDSRLWWMNGANYGEWDPTAVVELKDGQVLVTWDLSTMTEIDVNLQGEENYLDGWTGFGVTSTTGTSVISDINFYTEDEISAMTGGTATEIQNVEDAGTELAKEGIYTLSGVRLNKITKSGIYIVDGKKMFVK